MWAESGKYETVIGLEVHAQLATRTKVFCGCSTEFGAEPNTHVCPVCLGLPGSLPVLNRKAFEHSIRVAIALGCDIQDIVKFDRKNYYYPDLPKNYQISQFDMPIAYNGKISVTTESSGDRTIGITRAHMEEDAGKLMHDAREPFSYVDLNRTGTPLLEIVSEPDMRSPDEAYEYLVTLKRIIKYLGASDCNMEEGSLRCDANISLREHGETELGSKVEIKNLNSFKAVREALVFEQRRQEDVLENGGKLVQETRLWDEKRAMTCPMRTKEDAHDYRYFPEPDLVPFEVSPDTVEEIKKSMPELPAEKDSRFMAQYKLVDRDMEVLTAERETADFYEAAIVGYANPQAICNWVKGEVMKHMNERNTDITGLGLEPTALAEIVRMTEEAVISGLAAKDVLAAHLDTGHAPADIVKEKGLEQVSDSGELDAVIAKVIAANAKSANDYRDGKTNALSFLVGQVMKETRGKANPKIAGDMLKKLMSGGKA